MKVVKLMMTPDDVAKIILELHAAQTKAAKKGRESYAEIDVEDFGGKPVRLMIGVHPPDPT